MRRAQIVDYKFVCKRLGIALPPEYFLNEDYGSLFSNSNILRFPKNWKN